MHSFCFTTLIHHEVNFVNIGICLMKGLLGPWKKETQSFIVNMQIQSSYNSLQVEKLGRISVITLAHDAFLPNFNWHLIQYF